MLNTLTVSAADSFMVRLLEVLVPGIATANRLVPAQPNLFLSLYVPSLAYEVAVWWPHGALDLVSGTRFFESYRLNCQRTCSAYRSQAAMPTAEMR